MIAFKKRLSRRTMLRGLGAGIALPFLDAMVPAFSSPSATLLSPPSRLMFLYVPNGIIMKQWTPALDGPGFEFSPILQPLATHRENVLVLSGLTHNTGRPLGDGDGDHARAAATYLTGVHPKRTGGVDIRVGVSVDQIAAQQIGQNTRIASLELALEDGRMAGSCDAGYSCAYSNSISWRTPSMPMPAEINPRAVFDRLFGSKDEKPEDRARRLRRERTILDFVSEDARTLTRTLGPTDRRKLDEYFSSIRDIERRVELAESEPRDFLPTVERPDGRPGTFDAYARLMLDLIVAAFQTDITRVATIMLGREGSGRSYREIGIPESHHPLTHHRGNPEWIAKVARINTFHIEQFAYLIEKLKAIPEGDGTVLDHSVLVYGSGLSDGNRHDHGDLPVVVAGGGLGGKHLRYPKETPMNNLHLALLDRVGVRVESLGDSNGELNVASFG